MNDVERMMKTHLAMADGADQGRLVEEEGWTLLVQPEAHSEYRNGVWRAHLDPGDVEARIDAALERFAGTPFRWHIGPTCGPEDLGDRLLARGLVHADTMEGLTAETVDLMNIPSPDLVVEEVLGEGPLMEEWLAVTRDSWDMQPDAVERFREELLAEFAKEPLETLYFVVRDEGRVIGTSGLSILGDHGHLSGSCVLPDFRGCGAYRALVRARARVLEGHGIHSVTVMARASTSSPILSRLGFRKVGTIEVYAHRPG
ncbi:MAG: GNAT family N-acetyltransferase [Planctomycetota bacterium]|jgi:N-acetylglutamate synthase-like GNAT family acetyltransferase